MSQKQLNELKAIVSFKYVIYFNDRGNSSLSEQGDNMSMLPLVHCFFEKLNIS